MVCFDYAHHSDDACNAALSRMDAFASSEQRFFTTYAISASDAVLAQRSCMISLQPVTALAFADGGRLLVSGGEDTLAHAWLLMDVLDAEAATVNR